MGAGVDNGDAGAGRPGPRVEPVTGPASPAQALGDTAALGVVGLVTVRIGGGEVPGEVRLYVRGTYEQYLAYCDEPCHTGSRVKVVGVRGPLAVQVVWLAHA